MCESALTVLAFSVELKNEDEEETTITNINLQLSMPVEIDLLGVLFVDQCEQKIPDAFQVYIFYLSAFCNLNKKIKN